MPEEVWLDVLGLTAKVVLEDPDLAADARRAWGACLAESSDSPEIVIQLDKPRADSPLGHGAHRAVRLERLTQALTVSAIGALAGRRLMLHACALADESSGRCVVLVGPSGMGKTTVSSTLGTTWSYVTDECVAIDDKGDVVPFPKPLSVITDGPAKRQVCPTELGLVAARTSTRVSGLILLQRDPAVAAAAVHQVATVQAVALLAEHASFLARLERPLGRMARLVNDAGGLKRVTYAEAAELQPIVRNLMAAES